MAITKYNFSVLNQNLISGIREFLTPLWNWTKIDSKIDTGIYNTDWVAFYIDNYTCLCFDFDNYYTNSQNAYRLVIRLQRGFYGESKLIKYMLCETYLNRNSTNANMIRVRFTKVGSGFMFGFELYTYDGKKLGDYTIPLFMCCDLDNTYAFVTNGIKVKDENSIVMPSITANEIYYEDMKEVETVSFSRKITEDVEQLIPICTNSGLYSTNGFTPFMTYNDTLTPKKFTLGGKQYYGNGLMVLLDE